MSAFENSRSKRSSSFHLSKPRISKCRKHPESGPQYRKVASGPSDLRGTRGTQLGHLGVSLIADVNKQGLTPSSCERRKRFGNRHRVATRGHLGKKGAVQKGPKASSLVAERIIVISMRHLIRPRSWFFRLE
jgi:hypothetical protein